MNVGIFTDTYYPQINGVVTSIRMLERELEKLGHEVFIFTVADPNAPGPLARVFRLPSMPFVFLPSHRVTFLYSPKLLVNIRKFKLDIVHTQTEFPVGIFGKVVSEVCKAPMVHTYHTMYEDYVHYVANGHLITPKMAQQYSRVFCNRAKVVIAPAAKTKDYLAEIGVVRPVEVIPTGLNFRPFAKENFTADQVFEARKALGLSKDAPVIVTVGRVAKEKSIDVLISAMPELNSMLPEARLVIFGNGPVLGQLKEQAERLGVKDSVIFAGERPWDEIPICYQIGDVFAMASVTETQGLTYIEAMASRVPVVVKRDRSVEGVIVHNETGYCFEKDQDAAKLLYHALTHKEEAAVLAEKCLANNQHLSSEHFGKSVEAAYLEAQRLHRERKLEKQ
jgi:1,2-diacylglycerol 3-alpha-glucosyltransferase